MIPGSFMQPEMNCSSSNSPVLSLSSFRNKDSADILALNWKITLEIF